ncbi:MAG: DUF5615 family PIN-like protein [Oscillatoriales cyanobacterium RU_3_3]|nr:DUF5615 family PIN-like protein [Microcoleus sp. SM1_3_4]NJM61467.1 DUF5615 family PIN-like protein [Oscillatoriales cyanobacterium RU_3_3]NJR23368.1 DUF5615 family PIN-like protein [Richelia sp. CSU_2_1]
MSRSLKLHLDENVSNAIAIGLRRYEINVTTATEAGLLGKLDELHVEFAMVEGRVIFTQDADFLRINRAGLPHKGIIYCHKNSRSIGEIWRSLVMIWEYLELDDVTGRVEFI